MLGRAQVADVDGVFSDRVESRRMAAKPTLLRQRVGNVGNQDVVGIRKQRPKADAGKGANEAVETIHTEKWNTARGSAQFPEGAPGRSIIGASAGGAETGSVSFPTQAGRTTERSEVFLASGNEVFALLDKTETGQCLVAIRVFVGILDDLRRTRDAVAETNARYGSDEFRFRPDAITGTAGTLRMQVTHSLVASLRGPRR